VFIGEIIIDTLNENGVLIIGEKDIIEKAYYIEK
jgi:hypothetical protein